MRSDNSESAFNGVRITRIDICAKCAPTIRKALLTAGVSESKIPAPPTPPPDRAMVDALYPKRGSRD
jgi:hypothetical protein